MGDNNIYNLLFQNHATDLFSQVIEAAGSLGYSCVFKGGIRVAHHPNDLEFGSVQAAQTHLYLEGGHVTFIRYCESCEDGPGLNFDVSFESKGKALSLSSPVLLRKDNWSLVELAVDLRRLWHILSQRLKPLYGYATTAWTFDEVANNKSWGLFEEKLVYYSTPPVLFWANYFDWPLYENIDKNIFDEVHHRKYIMPEEYACIYLAEFPWDNPQLAILKNWKYQLVTDN